MGKNNKNNFRRPEVQEKSPYRLWLRLKVPYRGRETMVYYAKTTMHPEQARQRLEREVLKKWWDNIHIAKMYDAATGEEVEEWRPDQKTEA